MPDEDDGSKVDIRDLLEYQRLRPFDDLLDEWQQLEREFDMLVKKWKDRAGQ